MRVLIIKTSSLGDILNTFPALTDAGNIYPTIEFDWVVEKSFTEVPQWHPLVKKVIPVNLREWRKNPWRAWQSGAWKQFLSSLREKTYDLVIDAQGLIKSGFLTALSRGPRCGYDRHSAWESLACLAYQRRYTVKPKQHAITRIRKLFALCLNYPNPSEAPDCGLHQMLLTHSKSNKYCIFLHGTARSEKCLPKSTWQELIILLKDTNLEILLPFGNEIEKQRAEALAENHPHVKVLPKSSLTMLKDLIAKATFIVAVDTGLGHLAAALNVRTISLYGPTYPEFNGTVGDHQKHIKAMSMKAISAPYILQEIAPWLGSLNKN